MFSKVIYDLFFLFIIGSVLIAEENPLIKELNGYQKPCWVQSLNNNNNFRVASFGDRKFLSFSRRSFGYELNTQINATLRKLGIKYFPSSHYTAYYHCDENYTDKVIVKFTDGETPLCVFVNTNVNEASAELNLTELKLGNIYESYSGSGCVPQSYDILYIKIKPGADRNVVEKHLKSEAYKDIIKKVEHYLDKDLKVILMPAYFLHENKIAKKIKTDDILKEFINRIDYNFYTLFRGEKGLIFENGVYPGYSD